jgi:hypothetical protein
MGIIVSVIVLIGLSRLLDATNNYWLCAVIYTIVVFALRLMMIGQTSLAVILISTAISFCLAVIYFGLLNRFRDSILYWIILIVGLLIGLV